MKDILFAILFIICISINCAAGQIITIDDFENGLKPQWECEKFKGETRYSIVKTDTGHVLKAESNASASALIFKYEYDLKEYFILTWRWKIENIINKGDEMKKDSDDYAARVCVIFPHWFPSLTKKSLTFGETNSRKGSILRAHTIHGQLWSQLRVEMKILGNGSRNEEMFIRISRCILEKNHHKSRG